MRLPENPAALDAVWLEELLREGGVFRDARIARAATEVVGVGFGLDGTAARVTIDGEGVPRTLVLKWSSAENGRAEAHFYRAAAPRVDLRLPALLGARIDEAGKRGVLALSDVTPARQGDTLIGATERESDALVDAMAALHAPFWGAAEVPVLAPLPKWAAGSEDWRGRMREALPRFVAEWKDRLPAAALAAAADLPERCALARERLARSPATLLHADLHLDNVLFVDEDTPVVLDWPSACRGPAAFDLSRLLVEGMTSESRRARGDRLTLRYAAALAARGVRCDIEQLRADGSDVAALLYASAVRWATGPGATRPGVPRVELLVDSLVRRAADAVTEAA